MSAESAALTRSWTVGPRTCTLTIPQPSPGQVLSAVIEWDPQKPNCLTRAEMAQYLAGRDAALAEISAELRNRPNSAREHPL